MAAPVFATSWDVLLARVVIGVDRSTGVFSGSEPSPGRQMVCVWTTEERAEAALHVESWELRPITVRALLAVLPPGIGIVIDPEHPTGHTASANHVAHLKRYARAFPDDTTVQLAPWDDLSEPVRDRLAVAASADDLVRDVHAFRYTVDDSPALGCLAYVAGAGATGTAQVVDALQRVLDESADPAELGVAAVNVVRLDDVPEPVREALGDAHVLRRPRRARFWQR